MKSKTIKYFNQAKDEPKIKKSNMNKKMPRA